MKVCGSDGIPIEWYQNFFSEIQDMLHQAILEMAKEGMNETA